MNMSSSYSISILEQNQAEVWAKLVGAVYAEDRATVDFRSAHRPRSYVTHEQGRGERAQQQALPAVTTFHTHWP